MTAETPAPQHGRDCDPGCGCRDPKRAIPPTHVILQRLDVDAIEAVILRASWPDGDRSGFPTKRVAGMLATAIRTHILGGEGR